MKLKHYLYQNSVQRKFFIISTRNVKIQIGKILNQYKKLPIVFHRHKITDLRFHKGRQKFHFSNLHFTPLVFPTQNSYSVVTI